MSSNIVSILRGYSYQCLNIIVNAIMPDQLFDFLHYKSFITLDNLLATYQHIGLLTYRYTILIIVGIILFTIIIVPFSLFICIIILWVVTGLLSQLVAIRYITHICSIIQKVYYYITDLLSSPHTPYRRLSIKPYNNEYNDNDYDISPVNNNNNKKKNKKSSFILPSPFRLLRMIPSPKQLQQQGFRNWSNTSSLLTSSTSTSTNLSRTNSNIISPLSPINERNEYIKRANSSDNNVYDSNNDKHEQAKHSRINSRNHNKQHNKDDTDNTPTRKEQ